MAVSEPSTPATATLNSGGGAIPSTPVGGDAGSPSFIVEARSEIANAGPREQLSTLADEFRFNAKFGEKVSRLEEHGYDAWRRIRGDGNCFYRAVGFAILEELVMLGSSIHERVEWITEFHERLARIHFGDAEDAASHADLLGRLGRLRDGGGWEVPAQSDLELTPFGVLYRTFRDAGDPLDLALIRAIRQMLAEYLLAYADDESVGGGISFATICMAGGYDSVADYNRQVVLPLGTEAEGICLNAVPKALDISLRIAFLDRSESSDLTFCDYFADGDDAESQLAQSRKPFVHVQLRPGHYDLLYLRERSPAAAGAIPTFRDEDDDDDAATANAPPQPRPPTLGLGDPNQWEIERPVDIDGPEASSGVCCGRGGSSSETWLEL